MTETGTIRKWVAERGFGFIGIGTGTDEDLFFHISEVSSGVKPFEGDRVEFERGENKRTGKPQAIHVVVKQ